MERALAIEMAPFRMADGVTAAELLAASDALERNFLALADGYLGRVLVKKDATSWADIVFWESAAHAAKAMESVASSEACRAYFGCMASADHDDPGEGVTLFEAVRRYGKAAA
ncbi:MAG TPA: hypothetical protein VLD39_01485 [Gammaproteobacteria bacterium]|nr:hypothetical protein [Gammaproteobacteria bacterium]